MNLTEKPQLILWSGVNFIFIEKVVTVPGTEKEAWDKLHALLPYVDANNKITNFMSLSRYGNATRTFRAGVALKDPPQKIPKELGYEEFEGGKYALFILTGGDERGAYQRINEIITAEKLQVSTDRFFGEAYFNNPAAQDEPITHIFIPVA